MDKKIITWGVSFGSLTLVAGMVSYLGFNVPANASTTKDSSKTVQPSVASAQSKPVKQNPVDTNQSSSSPTTNNSSVTGSSTSSGSNDSSTSPSQSVGSDQSSSTPSDNSNTQANNSSSVPGYSNNNSNSQNYDTTTGAS